MGPFGAQALQRSRSAVDHGFLRALQPVRRDARDNQARNKFVEMAGVLIRLYDGAGLLRSAGGLSDNNVIGVGCIAEVCGLWLGLREPRTINHNQKHSFSPIPRQSRPSRSLPRLAQ